MKHMFLSLALLVSGSLGFAKTEKPMCTSESHCYQLLKRVLEASPEEKTELASQISYHECRWEDMMKGLQSRARTFDELTPEDLDKARATYLQDWLTAADENSAEFSTLYDCEQSMEISYIVNVGEGMTCMALARVMIDQCETPEMRQAAMDWVAEYESHMTN